MKGQKEIENVKDVFIEIGTIDPITKEINYSLPIKNQNSEEHQVVFVPSLDTSKIIYS